MLNDNYELHRTYRFKFDYANRRYLKSKSETLKLYNISFEKIYNQIGKCPGSRHLYNLDHIIPLSSFDFNVPEHFTLCYMPTNLRWLYYKDNFSKGNTIISIVYDDSVIFEIQELKEYFKNKFYNNIDKDDYLERLYRSKI